MYIALATFIPAAIDGTPSSSSTQLIQVHPEHSALTLLLQLGLQGSPHGLDLQRGATAESGGSPVPGSIVDVLRFQ